MNARRVFVRNAGFAAALAACLLLQSAAAQNRADPSHRGAMQNHATQNKSESNTPRRIVSLSPNVTEMLYGIGAFGDLVGVSDFCTYPPQAAKLASVGAWDNPSLEKLAALRPDLVIVDDAQAPLMADHFRDLGLRILSVPDHSIDQVYAALAALGRATHREDNAQKLMDATRDGLGRVAQKSAAFKGARPSVVMIVDRTPGTLRELYAATADGYFAELVDIAGGRMAVPAAKDGYAKLSKEDLLAINPDIIFDFIHGATGRFSADPLEPWSEMPELKAVRAHRVYGVNEDYVPHASQRMVQTAELFARLIHLEKP